MTKKDALSMLACFALLLALVCSCGVRVVYVPVEVDTALPEPDTRECVTIHTTPPETPEDAILVCSGREGRLYCVEYEEFEKRTR